VSRWGRAPRVSAHDDLSVAEYDVLMLRSGFRVWPVGHTAREVMRAKLLTLGYDMPDAEFAAARVPLTLGMRDTPARPAPDDRGE